MENKQNLFQRKSNLQIQTLVHFYFVFYLYKHHAKVSLPRKQGVGKGVSNMHPNVSYLLIICIYLLFCPHMGIKASHLEVALLVTC